MPEQFLRAREIFLKAVDLPPAERSSLLDRECGSNNDLRAEIESLLKHHDPETILPRQLPTTVHGEPSNKTVRTEIRSPLGVKPVAAKPRFVKSIASASQSLLAFLFGTALRKALVVTTACLLLLCLAWWMLASVHRSVQQQVEARLVTVSQMEAEALTVWIHSQMATSEAIASDSSIRPLILKIAELGRDESAPTSMLLAATELAELRQEMQPLLKAHDYQGFAVVGSDRRILAAQEPVLVGDRTMALGLDELDTVFADEPRSIMVLPFASAVPLPGDDEIPRAGKPTMFSVAPVLDEQGNVVAAIGFRIPPDRDFKRILAIARPGETGESYAFNREGLLLSRSRFDGQLREIGLLPGNAYWSSTLTVALRDPGGDMTKGYRPNVPRNEQPLTLMATQAIAGNDGMNLQGYRDYRGVRVVGVWQWLDEFDFGIATEVDYDEAYAHLRYLRWMFGILLTILFAAVCFSFRSVFSVMRLRREVDEARQIGNYRLERLLGEGGMGQVYLGQHALLKRPTAIKLLRADRTSGESIARFEREVQLASQLNHPNTVEIFDFGVTPDGVFYCAMEYLPGFSLDKLIDVDRPMPLPRAISILIQICRSLREAHDKGLVHRDIKPQNIMLCERGGEYDVVKVLDFGLAKKTDAALDEKLTAEFQICGTPLYIAPESINAADEIDARADIYALGVVAFELLTGTQPFIGHTLRELIGATIAADPPRCSDVVSGEIPPTLDDLVLACLSKDPAQRPQHVAEMLSALLALSAANPWPAAAARKQWLEDLKP